MIITRYEDDNYIMSKVLLDGLYDSDSPLNIILGSRRLIMKVRITTMIMMMLLLMSTACLYYHLVGGVAQPLH